MPADSIWSDLGVYNRAGLGATGDTRPDAADLWRKKLRETRNRGNGPGEVMLDSASAGERQQPSAPASPIAAFILRTAVHSSHYVISYTSPPARPFTHGRTKRRGDGFYPPEPAAAFSISGEPAPPATGWRSSTYFFPGLTR